MLRLRLYIHGDSPRSAAALRRVENFRAEHPPKEIHLEVVDVLVHPDLSERDKVIATPTLIRVSPLPSIRILGDLEEESVLDTLFSPPPAFTM